MARPLRIEHPGALITLMYNRIADESKKINT